MDEPTHEEDTNKGTTKEGPACDEQMPPTDWPLSKEQGPEGQMQSVKPMLTEAVTVTAGPFKGRALSEGPISETLLERQSASELHEGPSNLVKPLSEPALKAIALEEPVAVSNAQLALVEEAPLVQVETKPMLTWCRG